MIPVQFRPKYGIEQYVITFQFPEGSTGDVKLAVEVEIGEPGLLLGPVFRFQYTVSVGIAGGVPGSVYRILCSFGDTEFVGRVAVKESAAVVPDGAAVAPFTQVVTTPLYPIQVAEVTHTSVTPLSGNLRLSLRRMDAQEHHSTAVLPLGGNLRFPLVTTETEDHVTTHVLPLGGVMREPLQLTEFEDRCTTSVTPTGGLLRMALIKGRGEDPKHTTTITPLGGKLS